MATPAQVLAYAAQEAERQGVPVDLVQNMVKAESGGDINAVSSKGAVGPMQLMPATAKDLGVNPNNWQQNVQGGVKYIGQMLAQFEDPRLAVAAYNAGPGNVQKHGGVPPFKETQNYVNKVVGMAEPKDEWSTVSGIQGQAVAKGDWTPVSGIGGAASTQVAPQSFAGDVQTGITQAIKGGTPTAQAVMGGIDMLSSLINKGLTSAGINVGPNSAQAELNRRATESAAQPKRTIGETLSAVGDVAMNRPGLLLGSLAVPDPTSVFLPAKIAGATEKALTTAGAAPRIAERAGQVAGAAGTGVTQAALGQVGAPNADQFMTEAGLSVLTAPLAAVGGARTPVQKGTQLNQNQVIAQRAIDQGIALPPSQVAPDSNIARILEGASGQSKTAQLASMKNQEVVNKKARQTLGLPEDTPITPQTLKSYRDEQGAVYDAVKSNNYYADGKFLNSVNSEIERLSKLKGVNTADEIATLQNIKELQFDGNSLVEIVKRLREDANSNMMPTASAANKQLGKAQKFASNQLEDMIERTLERTKGNADLLSQFKTARQNIAKSYTIEKATNLVTGDVSGAALGARAKAGKIVPSELQDVANAAAAYPLAFQNVSRMPSPQALSGSDIVTGVGTAVATGQPLTAAAAAARPAGRSVLTSDMFQRMIRPQSPTMGPVRPSARPAVMPYLATTPFQPVTSGLFDYMNK